MEILFMKPDNDSGKQRSTDFRPVGLSAKRNDFQSAPYANTELPFLHMEIRRQKKLHGFRAACHLSKKTGAAGFF